MKKLKYRNHNVVTIAVKSILYYVMIFFSYFPTFCRLYDHRTDQELYEGVDKEGKFDFTTDAHLFLESLHIGSYALGTYVLFIRGSKSARIKEYLQKKDGFGSGKDKSDDWWKGIGL